MNRLAHAWAGVDRITAAMKSTTDAVAARGARVGDRFAPALISLTLDEGHAADPLRASRSVLPPTLAV
jgi:hypothetical protein